MGLLMVTRFKEQLLTEKWKYVFDGISPQKQLKIYHLRIEFRIYWRTGYWQIEHLRYIFHTTDSGILYTSVDSIRHLSPF